MKKNPFLEAMGTVDEKFLEEVLSDSKKPERRHISMNKKKTVMIIIAAVLVMTMGVTAVAAGISKISTLGSYFEDNKAHFKLPDEVPIMDNPEDYAKEVTGTAPAVQSDNPEAVSKPEKVIEYTPPAPGEAKITAVSATKRSLFVTYEFNAAGLDIPQELPEDARPGTEYQFEWVDVNFMWTGGGATTLTRSGDIFTGVAHWSNIFEFPEDEIVFKLQNLGYTAIEGIDKVHKTVKDIEVEMRLPVSEIKIMESIKSTNTAKLTDADSTAELSAYELIIYSDAEQLYAAGYNSSVGREEGRKNQSDFYFNAKLEVHMLDGTAFTEHLFTNQFGTTHMVGSMSGFIDKENGRDATVFGFDVPLDVSKIDYIAINDIRFDFAATKTDTAAAADPAQPAYTHPAPGEAKITEVSATRRSLYITYEFNASGLNIPQELPADAKSDGFIFEREDANFICTGGKTIAFSRSGDIFTGILYRSNILNFPEDEIVINLQRFGYYSIDEGFKTLEDTELELKLPVSEIDFLEPEKSENSVKLADIDYRAELSPYELMICTNFDSLIAAGLDPEDPLDGWNEIQNNSRKLFWESPLELHMLDGTVFAEDPSPLVHSNLVTTKSGFRDEKKRICADVFSFDVPLDVSKVAYITIGDARFDFAAASPKINTTASAYTAKPGEVKTAHYSRTSPAPEAKITSALATRHSLYLLYEFNAAGLDIPQELPEDAQYEFEGADANFIWNVGKGGKLSHIGDRFLGLFHWNNISDFPEDEIVIKLQRLGYTPKDGIDKAFKTVKDIEVEMRLPVSEIKIMESIKSTNTADVMGADSTADMSPYELIIYSDREELVAAGYADALGEGEVKKISDYFLKAAFAVHNFDGTVLTDYLITDENGISHITGGLSGVDGGENSLSATVLSFESPVDISQVAYITIGDARFDFAR